MEDTGRTTLSLTLPFSVHGMKDGTFRSDPNPIRADVLLPDGSTEAAIVEATVQFSLVHHEAPPILARSGVRVHGGRANYNSDSHGMFAYTAVTIEFDRRVRFGTGFAGVLKVLEIVNSLIAWHSAQNFKPWIPRATPADVCDLRVVHEPPLTKWQVGSQFSWDNNEDLLRLLRPLFHGANPYRLIRHNWEQQWGQLYLDAVNYYLGVRLAKAATTAAMAFELYVNWVLRDLGRPLDHGLRKKCGGGFLGRVIGKGLDHQAHGPWRDVFELVSKGRDSLVHKGETNFAWRTTDGEWKTFDAGIGRLCAEYLVYAALLMDYIDGVKSGDIGLGEQRSSASEGTVESES